MPHVKVPISRVRFYLSYMTQDRLFFLMLMGDRVFGFYELKAFLGFVKEGEKCKA